MLILPFHCSYSESDVHYLYLVCDVKGCGTTSDFCNNVWKQCVETTRGNLGNHWAVTP